jgi:RNA polymerase sigma-70 factor, ECF subfamily
MTECIAIDIGAIRTEVFLPNMSVKTVKNVTDHQLIEAVKQGDETAFDEIVKRYQQPITNYVFRILNDYEEAVDISQESFVRVYFSLDRYSTEYAFSTYIYRIATNLAISEIRKRKRRKLFSFTGFFQNDGEESDFDAIDIKDLQDEDLVKRERKSTIAKAIESLPEKYRLPIILRDIEERNYDEIAKILELGIGTTKSRISRGRAILRDKLADYFGNKDEN